MTEPATRQLRHRFPGLAGDWTFFDNAGGSLVLDTVADRVAEYLRTTPVQTGAGYAASRLAVERLDEAAQAMATLLGCEAREIVFGPSASALLERLARALAPQLEPGDEVIVTDADHEANITPWRRLAERGVTVRTWPVNTDSWRLEPAELPPLLNARTRLVCVTQASNILGGVEAIPEIARLSHRAGARVVVDGVAFAPHRLADVRAWDADYYVFSGYKVFGPHIGVLYGKYEQLLQLANLNHEHIGKEAVPYKLQPGAFSYELAWGMTAVTAYLEELGGARGREGIGKAWARIAGHERTLTRRLLEFVTAHPRLRLIGPGMDADSDRLPIISFCVDGLDSAAVPAHTDRHYFGIRYGHFHAKRLIDRLGLAERNGVVRVSLAHYNTEEEVGRLIDCLDGFLS